MKRILLSLSLLILSLALLRAEDGAAFFDQEVLPLLKERCFECHSHSAKIKGGLALDVRSGWETGGDHGPAVAPGKLDESLLIEAVRYTNPDMEMPPKGKLAAAEIAVLEKWVSLGAPDPRTAPVAKERVIDLEAGRQFWAFRPVANPPAPAVKDETWPLTGVDKFLLANLEAASLHPAPDADAYTWLRRVSYDLTGLPPTPAEIQAFIADTSPQARETVVDRLLNSRAFGERWARHWLDLTGYADQIGTSNNVFAEHAWRYRDYVIAALNSDKPFDRFIREQIAGDLLPFTTPEERAANLTATGFLVLGDVEIVAVDKVKMEVDLVDQQVSKVGTAFMGMTMGCVRCHDHKFDPIGQQDYYAMAGIFRSTDATHKTERGVWSSVNATEIPETAAEKADRERRAAEHAAKLKSLETARAAEKDAAKIKPLDAELEHTRFLAPVPPRTYAVRDRAEPADMRITIRGNPHALGEVVPRGVVRVANPSAAPVIPKGQSGRVQLADWLASPQNPLTARVTVNRVWQKLFGEGLVRTVDYLGERGERPSHPELLDHLAGRFMAENWSMKTLIRHLALSRAYRMSSHADAAQLAGDPENRLFSRANRPRLDAEAIRDGMLAVSGAMVESSGGPAMPLEFVGNIGDINPKSVNPPSFRLNKFRPDQEFQRTVYLPILRSAGQPGSAKLRDLFDFTQPAQMTGQRAETAVPTQALFLINSEMLRQRARELTARLGQESPDAKLEHLWLRVLNRPITAEERADAHAFLASIPALSKDQAAIAPWVELSHALLSSNEFLLRL